MGACFDSVVWDACTKAELTKFWENYQEDERAEHGSSGYNGTCSTCGGLSIWDHMVFDRVSDAEAFLSEKLSKRDAAAVKVNIYPAFSAKDEAKLKEVWGKAQVLHAEAENYWRAVILPRVRAGKSKTKGCDCGSQIAVSHIQGIYCPVCRKDFLTTETDKKAIARLREKRDKFLAEHKELTASLRQKHQPIGYKWVLGWWAGM